MNITLFSYHTYQSVNKAGFHFIAEELLEQKHNVTFVSATTSLITLSKAKSRGIDTSRLNKQIQITPQLYCYNLCSILPLISYRIKLIDKLIYPLLLLQYRILVKHYLQELIAKSDVIVFESIPFIALVPLIKELNPNAKLVYRVSDLFKCIPNQPSWVVDMEKTLVNYFDIVSVPSSFMYEYYLACMPNKSRLQLDYHGVDIKLFDENTDSTPYKHDSINVVWSGVSNYDSIVVSVLAIKYPDIQFHIIGSVEAVTLPNVTNHGMMKFNDTIRYIKYADIGLANRSYSIGGESLSDSLKIKQYTYCNLPILAPKFMHYYRGNNMFFYEDSNDSIIAAFEKCLQFDRNTTDLSGVYDWSQATMNILNKVTKGQ